MRRHILLLIALWIASPRLTAQGGAVASRGAPEIVVSGIGSVRLKSDRATVTVAVLTRGMSAATASRQNAQQFQTVLTALKRQGLPDTALATIGYTVALEQDPLGRAPAASPASRQYVARNAVSVSLTNLDLVGQLLDTALTAGATEITNITFASSRETQARDSAIGEAVRAAHADAAAAATATGGTLGSIIEINLLEDYARAFGAVVVGGGSVGYANSSTPLRARDVTVSVRVRVRYAFVPRA